MENIIMLITLGILGALLGSFVGAQVWRLRAKQLVDDKKAGEEVDERELKRINQLLRPVTKDRSECLYCHHQLAWYDLIPVFSWIMLKGKCRYCKRGIGSMELLLELGMASVFVASYLFWPVSFMTAYGAVGFGIWLIACVLMAFLFAYDSRWFLLPFSINVALIIVASAFAILRGVHEGFTGDMLGSLLLGIAIMAGLYFVFSLFGWVGLGDSILGLGLALLLGRWDLAFLAVFLANLLGSFMLIPLALRGNLKRNAHIPFGPFLIAGAVISVLWGADLIRIVFSSSDAILNLLMV